ncbi:T9SS type A sorting domain-containing protein [Longimonas halophila]|nr:T9SS type A sorting domain-containing protein [Longimonas halophila]
MIICPSALASQVSSFEAEPQGEAAQLAWTTTGSMGEGDFLVQHRADSTAAWSDLQTVEVAERTRADSTDAPTYQIETDALAPGPHQFRLQWAAGGETALLSDVVEAEITLEDPYRLRAYPNPAGAQMTVEGAVKERQHVRVQIYDVLGRRVTTVYDGPMAPNEVKRFTVQPGTEGLSSGTYFLRMTGEQFQTTTRISVVR